MSIATVTTSEERRTAAPGPDDAPRLDKMAEFVNLIFSGPKEYRGLVTIACSDGKGPMKVVMTSPVGMMSEKLKELTISKKRNYYITKGQAKRAGKWRAEDLFAINAMYIDIDNHMFRPWSVLRNTHEDENEILRLIYENLVNDGLLCEPNIVVYTGRGIHLVWLMEQVSAKLQGLYRFVCSQYCHMISEVVDAYNRKAHTKFSVDDACSKKAMGLTRLPETYNTATGEKSFFKVLHLNRMDLPKEFDTQLGRAEERGYCPSTGRRKKKTKKTWKKPADCKDAGRARVDALLKLMELRGGDMEGCRAKFLLIYFSALEMSGTTKEEALNRAIAMDESFRSPLGARRVRCYLSSAMRKTYKFKVTTIVSWLDISEKELRATGLGNCGMHSYQDKNAARDRRTAEKRERRDKAVMRWWNKGLNKSEIAKKMHLARNTVAGIIKRVLAAKEAKRLSEEKTLEEQEELKRRQAEARAHMWKVFWESGSELLMRIWRGKTYTAPPLEGDNEELNE